MKLLVVFLVFHATALTIAAYQFTTDSCKTLLPSINSTNSRDSKLTRSQDFFNDDYFNMADVSYDSSEEDEYGGILLPAVERSPYRIISSALNYRRNRVMTVTVEGPGFNGLLIQAVRRFPSSFSSRPSVVGNFVQLPANFDVMDCNYRRSVDYPSNTAFSTSSAFRKDLVLKWKAPFDDYDSIEFKATIIRGKYYWTHNMSPPLFFNHFPPSMVECGKEMSCLQYFESPTGCNDGICDYIVLTEVHSSHVVFNIGGRIRDEMGYVGIGFTTDDNKLSFLDMYVCIKYGHRSVDAAHYIYKKAVVHLERQRNLEIVAHDNDEDFIWCKFQRPLQLPAYTSAVNLTKPAHQAVIWGLLDFVTNDPILQDEHKIRRNLKPWSLTQFINVVQYGKSSHLTSHRWIILIAIIITKFLN